MAKFPRSKMLQRKLRPYTFLYVTVRVTAFYNNLKK